MWSTGGCPVSNLSQRKRFLNAFYSLFSVSLELHSMTCILLHVNVFDSFKSPTLNVFKAVMKVVYSTYIEGIHIEERWEFFVVEIQALLWQNLREMHVAFLSIFTHAELKNIDFLINTLFQYISVINFFKIGNSEAAFQCLEKVVSLFQ